MADGPTTSFLNSMFRLSSLVEKGISCKASFCLCSVIEKLELRRKSFPKMAAIYLLSNLPSSIELLCSDISNAQYGTYYIYTLSKLEEREFQQLATVVRANGSSIKAFVEGLCSVKFMGTNGFYLQSFEKELLGKLYGQVHSDAILEHTGEQLAAVIRQLCP